MTPYSRPAYQALLTRIEADLAAMPEVLRGRLSPMWARICNGMHGHLDWIDAQCSPLTCELERLYDWAMLYNVPRLLATAAVGPVLATGNVGAVLLKDSVLRGPNGLDYIVLDAVVLGAGNTAVTVRCIASGSAGNLLAGQQLTLVDPVVGVGNTLTVDAAGISGGAEDEPVNTWRARVNEEWVYVRANGARSGKPGDYRFWAKSAHPSVTGAIEQYHVLGMGTVIVRPICNGLADRLPTQAVLDAVAAAYETKDAPATADWRVTFAVARPIALNLHLLPGVDTQQNRDAIQSAIDALILAQDGSNADLLLLWGEVEAAIATVTTQYVLDESVPITWLAHEIPVSQPINWV